MFQFLNNIQISQIQIIRSSPITDRKKGGGGGGGGEKKKEEKKKRRRLTQNTRTGNNFQKLTYELLIMLPINRRQK